MIPPHARPPGHRAARAGALVAGGAAALALASARARGRRARRPTGWSRTAKDAVAGAPDLTRAQLGLASDRPRARRADARRALAAARTCCRRGAAGLAVRAPVDGDQARRHVPGLPRLRDGRAPTARPCAGPSSRPQPGEELARAGRGDRRAHQRPHDDPALLADARRTARRRSTSSPRRRKPGCTRVVVRRHGARSAQDGHLPCSEEAPRQAPRGRNPRIASVFHGPDVTTAPSRGRRRCLRGARAPRLRLR